MIYGPAFYKLLGIPESVSEPTAYHLLDLDPRMVTPVLVDHALSERKARLRQNIPGPRFIPIVSLIERELDQAAEILRDEARRQEYDERLLRAARARPRAPEGRKRRRLVRACRKLVRSTVDADGCLATARRTALAERLAAAGLPVDQVRYVLDHIPSPAGEQAPVADETAAAPDEAMAFFATAIETEIDRGLLDDPGERKLLRMAERFGIPADRATRAIDKRLAALGADRGAREETSLVGQFKLHVLAMHPMGDATEMDRRRLRALGVAQGLTAREADRVLRQYLPAGDAAEAAEPVDPLGVLEDLEAEASSAPAIPRRATRRPPVRWALDSAVAVALALVGIGAWRAVEIYWPRPAGSPAGAIPGPKPGWCPPTAGAASRPALLVEALGALPSRAKVRTLIERAPASRRTDALLAAADLLLGETTPREKVLVEGLYAALLGATPADGRVQHTAVRALMDRLRVAAASGQADRKGLYRAAGLLAGVLFLRATPGVAVHDPVRMASFLEQCDRAWNDSRAYQPADPAHDPRRLAYAVMAGGSLTAYAARSDEGRFAALNAALVRVAADPQEPGSSEALAALLASAGYRSYPLETRRAAREALCDVIRTTLEASLAGRVRATLAATMDLAYDDPLRAMPLASVVDRGKVASAFRQAIDAPAAPATRPAASAPATRPATSRPALPADILAEKVRASWTDGTRPAGALTDVAITSLACAARVARFTARSDVLTRELLETLRQRDATLRATRLTKSVRLLADDEEEAPAVASALAPKLAETLRRDVRSSVAGIRNRAIAQARVLDDSAAAGILLDRLDEIAGAVRGDLPAMNRILGALAGMSDPGIPRRLAKGIAPARTNYAAHRIVMTLLTGSGMMGSTDRVQYQLPVNHNSRQRNDCAALWQNLAASCSWGPRRLVGAVAGPVGPPPAWRPDPAVEKLLALFVHYTDLSAGLLALHEPVAGAEAPKAPELRPRRAGITAPTRSEKLDKALAGLVAELTRLARAHERAKDFAVKLDMIVLSGRARELACETALQRAAVSLDVAGKLLEVLVLEAGGETAATEAVTEIRRRRDHAVAEVKNVLIELREHGYWNLVLLNLLSADGP